MRHPFVITFSYYLRFILSFFFNDTATTDIYTLSLHDALPILFDLLDSQRSLIAIERLVANLRITRAKRLADLDRKSTRLNSSHTVISYAVFCLKKKKKKKQ